MSEYAERFAENRIDFSVLPDLTDHDLEKLGVALGDRRKMLRAIANLEAWKIAPVATVETAASTGPSPLDTAERRQVTVMFSEPCGLDCPFGPDGPGRPARGHFSLSERRRGDRASLWWFRREVHG